MKQPRKLLAVFAGGGMFSYTPKPDQVVTHAWRVRARDRETGRTSGMTGVASGPDAAWRALTSEFPATRWDLVVHEVVQLQVMQ